MPSETPAEIKEQIDKGISILKQGGIIAFPTDTIFGLGACFDDIDAIERIYRVKQRRYDKGLPLLVADRQQMLLLVASMPPLAEKLLNSFETGSLTLVLKKAVAVPDVVTGGSATVAVRITAHPVARALIKGLGKPVVATSANVSGDPSALTAEEVRWQLGAKIDLIIGGDSGAGKESTIIDVNTDIPVILRQGVVAEEEILKAAQRSE
ncbi:L-threonylcarbamoyladenylate synthase [Chloroflexota bacterium]